MTVGLCPCLEHRRRQRERELEAKRLEEQREQLAYEEEKRKKLLRVINHTLLSFYNICGPFSGHVSCPVSVSV